MAAYSKVTKIAHPGNVLEALPQMWLYGRRVLGLRQDLKQLIVWQEVEARERVTLSLQVVAETLLDLFQ